MSDLKAMKNLKKELSDEQFAALINSNNIERVKEFCDKLINDIFPTRMTVGGRVYEIRSFLKAKEEYISGNAMIARANAMGDNLGKEEAEHILRYSGDIPASLRGKVKFVFTDWRKPGGPGDVYCARWEISQWVGYWHWLSDNWDASYRVLFRRWNLDF